MKKVLISSKAIKYAKARSEGNTKEASKRLAGYSPNTLATRIEQTDAIQSMTIKESLLSGITMKELTDRHIELIKQQEDKGVSLNALKLSYDRIEPENSDMSEIEHITLSMKG